MRKIKELLLAILVMMFVAGCGSDKVTIMPSTGDTTPPAVIATVPANGATGVSLTPAVTITFSEALASGTITCVMKDAAGNTVMSTVTVSGSTATLAVGTLLANTAYTVTVSGAKDTAGNVMLNMSFSFTTGASTSDITPPSVTATSPSNGATGVSLTPAVTITYTEAITSGTGTYIMKDAAGNTVASTASESGSTATLAVGTLLANTAYTVTVSRATDAAGNVMLDMSFGFTTGASTADITPPTITATSPSNGAIGVSLTPTVTITFSEAIATLGSGTYVAKDAAGNTVASTVTVSGSTATVVVGTVLANTTYTVTISGVTDMATNMMVGTVSFSFTTGIGTGTTFALGDPTTAPFWADGDGTRATFDSATGIATVLSGGSDWQVNFTLKPVNITINQIVNVTMTCSNTASSVIYLQLKNGTSYVNESASQALTCDGVQHVVALTAWTTDSTAQLTVNLGTTTGTYTFNKNVVVQ